MVDWSTWPSPSIRIKSRVAADNASTNSRVVKVYGHEDDTWLQQNLIESGVLDALSRLVKVGPALAKPAASSSASDAGRKPPR